MTTKSRESIERIIETINTIDLLRDAIQMEFADLLKNAAENELSLKESCYINAAAAEFNDFYLVETLEALEKVIARKENRNGQPL